MFTKSHAKFHPSLKSPTDLTAVDLTTDSGESQARGAYVRPNGTKLYVVGEGTGKVHQWSLSTPWDYATKTYDGSFPIGERESGFLSFHDDGSTMFVGTAGGKIYQYSVPTPWDITSIATTSFDVSAQSANPVASFFKDDGTKMYIADESGVIYQYTLSTAWDVTTASYDSVSVDVSTEDSTPVDIFIGDAGTKLFVSGGTTDTVYRYTITTGWDLSSGVSYDSISRAVPNNSSIFFKDDGTRMYAHPGSDDVITQYNLGTAWDPSSDTSTSTNTASSSTITGEGVYFGSAGTLMYVIGNDTDTVFEHPLSTGWDITSFGASTENISVVDITVNPGDVFFKDDGTRMFILDKERSRVTQVDISTGWDLSTATDPHNTASVGTSDFTGGFFKPDGSKLFVNDTTDIYEYGLSTPFDPTTATLTTSDPLTFLTDDFFLGIGLSNDGRTIFLLSSDTEKVFELSLNNAWDLSSLVQSATNEYSVSGISTTWADLFLQRNQGVLVVFPDALSNVTPIRLRR